jgi:hypothetical protein
LSFSGARSRRNSSSTLVSGFVFDLLTPFADADDFFGLLRTEPESDISMVLKKVSCTHCDAKTGPKNFGSGNSAVYLADNADFCPSPAIRPIRSLWIFAECAYLPSHLHARLSRRAATHSGTKTEM